MQKTAFLLLFVLPFIVFGQNDTTQAKSKPHSNWQPGESTGMKVFHSQKLINANTVEVLPKGVLEFRVSHAFDDIAGDRGGEKNFFGLENSTDVRIGFQAGLTKNLNVLISRSKGGGPSTSPQKLYELGLKYQFLRQQENDPSHPLSITLFANSVISSMETSDTTIFENSFSKFSDRTSEVVQLMIARKFGKISLQLSPTVVTRGHVIEGDDKTLLAIGGAVRIPITPRFVFIADYFHTFRSQESKDAFADPIQGSRTFYDALGAGFEILTAGHVFHLNFTNATDLLENRFISSTYRSWGKGEFRWSFTISRNFRIFKDKK